MLKEHAEQKVLSKPQNLHGASAASCYMNIQHIFISHGLPVSTHQADSQHYPGLCLLYIQIIILYNNIIFIRENHFYLHQFWKNRQTHLNHRDRGRNESLVIILPLEDLEFIFYLSRDTYHICRALLVHTKLHTKYKLYHISLSLLAQIKAI